MFVALHLPSEHNFKSESDIELERASRLYYTPCLWSLITIPKGWFSTDSKKSDHWHLAKGSDQVISKMLNTIQSEVSSKLQLEKRVKQFVIIKSTWKKMDFGISKRGATSSIQWCVILPQHCTAQSLRRKKMNLPGRSSCRRILRWGRGGSRRWRRGRWSWSPAPSSCIPTGPAAKHLLGNVAENFKCLTCDP